MKRSFYEMLGVARTADQAQIDAAYALAMERLNAEDVRGIPTTVNEAQLIREGYQILCDLGERARYDAKLAASDRGVRIALFPEDSGSRRKLGVETIVFALVSAVLGAIVYAKLTQKTDEVLVEQKQAVARQKGEPSPPITAITPRPDTSDAPRPDKEGAKAGKEEQKR